MRIAYAHHGLRHHGARPQEKCGISRDHLRCGIGRNKSYDGLFLRNYPILDHLPDLHACRDTAHIPSLIGFSLKGMIIPRHCLITHIHIGCLAKLYIRVFRGQPLYGFAVSVKENDIASFPGQFPERLFRFFIRHIAAGYDLHPFPVFFLHRILRQ